MSCSLSRVTVILTLGLNDGHDNKTTDIEVIACSPMSRLRKGKPDDWNSGFHKVYTRFFCFSWDLLCCKSRKRKR